MFLNESVSRTSPNIKALATKGYPKISIITPCLNGERFIERAILSVKEQTYPHIEHIVIDGGSTDRTVEILKTFNHVQWISEPDQGQTDALNKGLRRATGDIIGWLNADDYYLPGAFQSVSLAFDRNVDADVVYGEFQFVDVHEQLIRRVHNSAFDARTLMFYRNYVPSNAAFWRKRIHDNGHFLDPSLKVVMDWDWWLQLSTLGYRFLFLPENLAAFRIRKDNIGTRLAHLLPEERRRIREKFEHHFVRTPMNTLQRDILFITHKGKRAIRRLSRLVH